LPFSGGIDSIDHDLPALERATRWPYGKGFHLREHRHEWIFCGRRTMKSFIWSIGEDVSGMTLLPASRRDSATASSYD
jgi:hypothetical protein